MISLQKLIDQKIVANNGEGARECELLAMWEPCEGFMLTHKHEAVMQVDQDEEGNIWIITHQGPDSIGEYILDPSDEQIDVDIYHKMEV